MATPSKNCVRGLVSCTDVSGADRATITQAIKEYGQSPVGNRNFNKFLSGGENFRFDYNSLMETPYHNSIARAEGNTMSIRMFMGIEMFRNNLPGMNAQNMTWDMLFAHEFSHLKPAGGYSDPLNVAYSENPYRSWIGQPRATHRGYDPVPKVFSIYQY